jgi:aldehyde dehydrogenase (NAD+)
MSRLPITKTPKCYVGGAFIRSESGRVRALTDASGAFFANVPVCSRKDLRNAVEAAAKAGASWAKRTPYNRGQILYRLAEMLEARSAEMAGALMLDGTSREQAGKEVSATLDRIVHYAGWADKYEQVLSSVNPVSSPHFNFTVSEPIGVIGLLAPDAAPLLGLLSLILPAITAGNSVIALTSETAPYPAILLGEMLATSDLPGGVVNLLTGTRAELIPTFATHEHLRAVTAVVSPEEAAALEKGAAESVKRVKILPPATDWFSPALESAWLIRDHLEFKTIWHPASL